MSGTTEPSHRPSFTPGAARLGAWNRIFEAPRRGARQLHFVTPQDRTSLQQNQTETEIKGTSGLSKPPGADLRLPSLGLDHV